jgi:hypothetical protein
VPQTGEWILSYLPRVTCDAVKKEKSDPVRYWTGITLYDIKIAISEKRL